MATVIPNFVWWSNNEVYRNDMTNAPVAVQGLQKPWHHATPFAIGVVLGFWIWRFTNTNIEGTNLQRAIRKIQESGWVRAFMHIFGTTLILLVIFMYLPLNKNRDSDNKAATAFLFTLSQFIIPIGLSLNFIPVMVNRSVSFKRYLESPFFLPFSRLGFIVIGLYGLVIVYLYGLSRNGQHFTFVNTSEAIIAAYLITLLYSLIMGILWIFPANKIISSILDPYLNMPPNGKPNLSVPPNERE